MGVYFEQFRRDDIADKYKRASILIISFIGFGIQEGWITTDIKTYVTNSKTVSTHQLSDESQSVYNQAQWWVMQNVNVGLTAYDRKSQWLSAEAGSRPKHCNSILSARKPKPKPNFGRSLISYNCFEADIKEQFAVARVESYTSCTCERLLLGVSGKDSVYWSAACSAAGSAMYGRAWPPAGGSGTVYDTAAPWSMSFPGGTPTVSGSGTHCSAERPGTVWYKSSQLVRLSSSMYYC